MYLQPRFQRDRLAIDGATRVTGIGARPIIPGLTPFARGAAEPHTALWLTLFITIAMIAAVGGGTTKRL